MSLRQSARSCSGTPVSADTYRTLQMQTPSVSSSGEPVNPGSKQKETLWILSEVYYPEVISTGYYLTSIAEGLTDKFDVRVITGQPKHMSRGLKAPKREV